MAVTFVEVGLYFIGITAYTACENVYHMYYGWNDPEHWDWWTESKYGPPRPAPPYVPKKPYIVPAPPFVETWPNHIRYPLSDYPFGKPLVGTR